MFLSGKIKHLNPTLLHKFTTLKNVEELDEFLKENKIELTEHEKDVAIKYIDTDRLPFSCEDAEDVTKTEWWEPPKDLLCPVCNGPVVVALLDGYYCNSCSTFVPR